MCSVCVLKVKSEFTIDNIHLSDGHWSAHLTNTWPYRDWLGTLGIVVLVLQRSVLGHWDMVCVRLLRTYTSDGMLQNYINIIMFTLQCVDQPDNRLVN